MPAGASADGDQTVDTRSGSFVRVVKIDDVVKYNAPVGVNRVHNVRRRAQGCDYQRRFVFHRNFEITIEPLVGPVNNQIYAERRHPAIYARQAVADFTEPLLVSFAAPLIQSREGANDA